MRSISPKRLREFWTNHADAEVPMRTWIKKAEKAEWAHFADTRRTFGSADQLTLRSRHAAREAGRSKTVTIFNVGGNGYRVIASVNYETGIVYLLFALTHAEYSKEEWKKRL